MNSLINSLSKNSSASNSSTSKVLKRRMEVRKKDVSKDPLQYLPEQKKFKLDLRSEVLKRRMQAHKQDVSSKDPLRNLPEQKILKLDPGSESPKKLNRRFSQRIKLNTIANELNTDKPLNKKEQSNGIEKSVKALAPAKTKRCSKSSNPTMTKTSGFNPDYHILTYTPRGMKIPNKLNKKSSRTKVVTKATKTKPNKPIIKKEQSNVIENSVGTPAPAIPKRCSKSIDLTMTKNSLSPLRNQCSSYSPSSPPIPKKLNKKSSPTKVVTKTTKTKPNKPIIKKEQSNVIENSVGTPAPAIPKRCSKYIDLTMTKNSLSPLGNQCSSYSPSSPPIPKKLNKKSSRTKVVTKATKTKPNKPIIKKEQSNVIENSVGTLAPAIPKRCSKSTDLTFTKNSLSPLENQCSSYSPSGPPIPKKLNKKSSRTKVVTKATKTKPNKPIIKKEQSNVIENSVGTLAPAIPKRCSKSTDLTFTKNSLSPLENQCSSYSPSGPPIPKKLNKKSSRTKVVTKATKTKPNKPIIKKEQSNVIENSVGTLAPAIPKRRSKSTDLTFTKNSLSPLGNQCSSYSPSSPPGPPKFDEEPSQSNKVLTKGNKSKPDNRTINIKQQRNIIKNSVETPVPAIPKIYTKSTDLMTKNSLSSLGNQCSSYSPSGPPGPPKFDEEPSQRKKVLTKENKSKPGNRTINIKEQRNIIKNSVETPVPAIPKIYTKSTDLMTKNSLSSLGNQCSSYSPSGPPGPPKFDEEPSQSNKVLTKGNKSKPDNRTINIKQQRNIIKNSVETPVPAIPKIYTKSTDLMTKNSLSSLGNQCSSYSPSGPPGPPKFDEEPSQRKKVLTKENKSKPGNRTINIKEQRNIIKNSVETPVPAIPKIYTKSTDLMTKNSLSSLGNQCSSYSPSGPPCPPKFDEEPSQRKKVLTKENKSKPGNSTINIKEQRNIIKNSVETPVPAIPKIYTKSTDLMTKNSLSSLGNQCSSYSPSGPPGPPKFDEEPSQRNKVLTKGNKSKPGNRTINIKEQRNIIKNSVETPAPAIPKRCSKSTDLMTKNSLSLGNQCSSYSPSGPPAAQPEGDAGESADQSEGGDAIKEKVVGWPVENLLSLDDFLSDNPQEESFSGEPTFGFETGKDILPENLNIVQFVDDLLNAIGQAFDFDEKTDQRNQLQDVGGDILAHVTCSQSPGFRFNVPVGRDQSARLLCSSCQDNFPSREALYRHKLLNHVGKVCNVCTQIFGNVRIFMEHVTKQHNSYTVCPECFVAVETNKFSNHAARHPASSKRVHERFQITSPMNPFMNIEQLKCRVCFQIFSTRNEVKQHERDHHKNSFHLCKICGELFLTQFDVQKHSSQKHLAIQRCICKVCYLDFCDSSSLSRHLRVAHDMIANKTPQKFECICCHHEFGNKIKFIQHIRVSHQNHALVVKASQGKESGTPKTKCPHCSSHFKNPKLRAVHEIIFHETPPYKCFCNEAFFTKATFDEHTLKHTRIMVEHMKANKRRSKKSV